MDSDWLRRSTVMGLLLLLLGEENGEKWSHGDVGSFFSDPCPSKSQEREKGLGLSTLDA